MGHNHSHAHSDTSGMGKRLLFSMGLNLLIPAAQIAGGIVAGSVALISDAVHNIGDFTALLIAYAAHKAGKRGPSLRHTFGFKRMEIFASVINAVLLGASAGYIAVEAINRLKHPEPVAADLVAMLALVGIAGNGLSAWLLHKDSKENLNARGAFLHMVGDLMTSVAVLSGALVMRFFTLPWLDPALSIVIVVYIVFNCVSLLKDALHVLMNGTPEGLDLEAVKSAMESVGGVDGIHYLHAWSMGDGSVALTCHVVVPDQLISGAEALAQSIREKLFHLFGIDHPVLQFETIACGHGALLCELSCGNGHECGHDH